VTDPKHPTLPQGSRKGLYIAVVSLNKVEKRLLNILSRDVIHLMRAVNEGQLDKNQSDALRGYLKLVRDLKDRDEVIAKDLGEDDLKKMVGDIK